MASKKKRKSQAKETAAQAEARIAHERLPDAIENEVAALVQASPHRGTLYTREEFREQLGMVEELLVQGAHSAQIARVLRGRWSTFTTARAGKLAARVRARWAKESEEARATNKEAQIRRLHQMRAWASGERDRDGKWIKPPDHKALAAYERLLMQIQGTAAPVEISASATITQALITVSAKLTGEEAAEYLEEAREQARLAAKARALLPAIVVEAEPGG